MPFRRLIGLSHNWAGMAVEIDECLTSMMLCLCKSAVVFQSFGIACRAIDGRQLSQDVLPYEQVCMAGVCLSYFPLFMGLLAPDIAVYDASTDLRHMVQLRSKAQSVLLQGCFLERCKPSFPRLWTCSRSGSSCRVPSLAAHLT